jgi:hypothetical protein
MKKALAILLIIVFAISSVNIMLRPVKATTTVIDTGAKGIDPVVSGSIIAFIKLGNPCILFYYNTSNNELVDTGVAVSPDTSYGEISISGNTIALIAPEGTIEYYDILTGSLENTHVTGTHPSMDGNRIAFLDNSQSTSWSQLVELKYYDISTKQQFNTGAYTEQYQYPSMSGSIIAFNLDEYYAGVDLNNDGDTSDWILEYYNIDSCTVLNTHLDSGMFPSVSASKIAFTTWEQSVGVDLNGDGSLSGETVRYYNVATNAVFNTAIVGASNMTSLSGSIIAYLSNGYSGGAYYNIHTNQYENIDTTALVMICPSIGGSIIAFRTGTNEIEYIDISQSTNDTPIGNNVSVNSVGTGISVTYTDVASQGVTTIDTSTANPGPDLANYQFIGTFTKISTTASFSGQVTLSFTYDPSIQGEKLSTLRVFHWDGQSWIDVTTSIDTVNHIIFAKTNSFSWFALASQTYVYSGIRQPINSDGSSIFKIKSTVSVKFQLQDNQGNTVETAQARIYIAKISNGIIGTEMEAVSTNAATTGNLFRYDGTQYIFNLGTKPLSAGTWQIRISLDDGTSHYIPISLR